MVSSAMPPNRCKSVARACLFVAVAGTMILAWSGLTYAQQGGSGLVGKPAPEFHLKGIYSEDYSLEKFKGHILVLQFGASW